MTKKQIRTAYRERRSGLTATNILQLDDLLLIRFQQWPIPDIHTLLSFQPMDDKIEVNTHLMTDYLRFRIPHLQVAYPVIDMSARSFKAVAVDDETEYRINAYGIAEPLPGWEIPAESIDLVFVPLLAFDNRGYRVGYGKGFYDRFLADCRPDTVKLGFSYFDPVAAIDDIDDFDVPLNVCITPNIIYEF